ncbi:hypothetical protein [Streptomyces violaceorubidus]|uniref:hypothetical protein n=1 Tax=Streptomyces violaceorubidus TaxID=284042 RepID=UPI0004C043CD|nr:hypothetical protein [Streptomyces violaceorubidus]
MRVDEHRAAVQAAPPDARRKAAATDAVSPAAGNAAASAEQPGDTVAGTVDEVRSAVQTAGSEPTVFTVDYPGARAEPHLAEFVRANLPGLRHAELPLPKSLDAGDIVECRRLGHAALAGATGPVVLLAYCSGAAWGRYLIGTLPPGGEAPAFLSVNGSTLTQQEWFEEFVSLAGRFAPADDLRAVAAEQAVTGLGSDLESRCAAARDVLAVMCRELEKGLAQRLGLPLGRAAVETLKVQSTWLSYLGACVVVGTGPAEPVPGGERALPGIRLDQGARVADWLRLQLAALSAPVSGRAHG